MFKFRKIIFPFGVLISTIASVVPVVACGSKVPQTIGDIKSVDGQKQLSFSLTSAPSTAFGADIYLDKDSYNGFYHDMKRYTDVVGIAVIANGKVDTDIVKIEKNETVLQALDSSKFIFKRYMDANLGAFINSYALRSKPNVFMHGTNSEKNYGDWYPMYYINHKYSQFGVSNFKLSGYEMLEFTFDKSK